MPSEETLRSRANPLYKRLRALKERTGERDLCLLEGPRLVLEALAAGLVVAEAVASPRAEASPAGPAALAELRQREVPIRRMAAELVASLSEAETSQGLLALARRPSFDEQEVFRRTPPLVLVADGVQNPGNLGGLLRTAEAAGASGAILTEGCADPFSWKALRGSMGSAFRLPHLRGQRQGVSSGSLTQDLDHALGWCEEEILKAEGKRHETGVYRLEDLYVELFPEKTSFFRLKEYLEKVEAPAGHVVFKQGDQADSMYFVEFGTVTVWLELPNGERTRLRTMGMGTVVGEMGFYLGIPRSGTVVTEKPCVLYRLSLASYQKMNVEDPELASAVHQFMVRLLANRLAHANKQLANVIA